MAGILSRAGTFSMSSSVFGCVNIQLSGYWLREHTALGLKPSGSLVVEISIYTPQQATTRWAKTRLSLRELSKRR